MVGALLVFRFGEITNLKELREISGWFLMVPAVASYLAMNFAGSFTSTSLSGVKKEMKWAIQVEISGAGDFCIVSINSRDYWKSESL